MKNIYLIGLGLILFFCSCYYKKDNPEPAKNVFNPKGTNVIMGCNVDGLNLEVYSQNCSIDRKNKSFEISAIGKNGKSIVMFTFDTVLGTHGLSSNDSYYNHFYNAQYTDGSTNFNYKVNGVLIINKKDIVNHTVSGSFSFTSNQYASSYPSNSKTISEGVFNNLPYNYK